jgi:hypothetical protein
MMKKPSSKRVQTPNKNKGWVKLDPVPPSTTVNLVYSTERTIPASTYEVGWDFRLNSLNDPDLTYTGSQPTYFDQWSALYGRYRVTEALVEVWCSNVTAAHCKLACAPIGLSSPASFKTEDVAGWRNSAECGFNSGGPLAYTKQIVKCHKVVGVNKEAYLAEGNYSATPTTNPLGAVNYAVRAKTYGSIDSVWLSVRITFRARFESPELVTLSATRKLPQSAATQAESADSGCKMITPRLIEHSQECAEGYSAGKGHRCSH